MKNTILLILLLIFFSCTPQIKINKSTDLDIILNTQNIKWNKENENIQIINKSEYTFLIDPLGFYGNRVYYENNDLAPLVIWPTGYLVREETDCTKKYILLKPFEKYYNGISTCNNCSNERYDLDLQKISQENKYFEHVKTKHNKYTIDRYGCKKYIEDLEKSGVKILEDSINVKYEIHFDFSKSKVK